MGQQQVGTHIQDDETVGHVTLLLVQAGLIIAGLSDTCSHVRTQDYDQCACAGHVPVALFTLNLMKAGLQVCRLCDGTWMHTQSHEMTERVGHVPEVHAMYDHVTMACPFIVTWWQT